MTFRHAVFIAFSLGLSSPALALGPACAQKLAGIEQQIQHATEAGNSRREAGLERALSAVRNHCTDTDLLADKKDEIKDKLEDIAELREEIQEKEAEGRLDKVAKLERKLRHEQEELDILQRELAEIETLIASGSK